MDYLATINSILKPSPKNGLKVLDLFAGAGGLALGFEAQGFETIGFEMDEDCCKTYENNLKSPCIQAKITSETEFPKVDVIIGGPPCQPFSVGGNQKGSQDDRNGFPAFIKAVRDIQPRMFLIENVRGLLYKNKHYLDEVVSELASLGYKIDYQLFSFVEFGVPQNRQRVIIAGYKSGTFNFPEKINVRVTAGQALGELATQVPADAKFLTPAMEEYIAKYEAKSFCTTPRDLHLDRPARTLTCRNLAGATGDMHRIKLPDGRRRRITVREAARLQSFPDHYIFEGTDTSAFYQIGNAVPPLFAYQLAAKVKEHFGLSLNEDILDGYKMTMQPSLITA